MRWCDIPFSPAPRLLRQFAGLWLLFFGGLAGVRLLREGMTPAAGVLAAVAALGLVGLYRPALARPVFVAAMVLTFPLGWVVSRLSLAVLYHGLFTPLALLFRLAGRDPLGLRFDARRDSYWEARPAAEPWRYYCQF